MAALGAVHCRLAFDTVHSRREVHGQGLGGLVSNTVHGVAPLLQHAAGKPARGPAARGRIDAWERRERRSQC